MKRHERAKARMNNNNSAGRKKKRNWQWESKQEYTWCDDVDGGSIQCRFHFPHHEEEPWCLHLLRVHCKTQRCRSCRLGWGSTRITDEENWNNQREWNLVFALVFSNATEKTLRLDPRRTETSNTLLSSKQSIRLTRPPWLRSRSSTKRLFSDLSTSMISCARRIADLSSYFNESSCLTRFSRSMAMFSVRFNVCLERHRSRPSWGNERPTSLDHVSLSSSDSAIEKCSSSIRRDCEWSLEVVLPRELSPRKQ